MFACAKSNPVEPTATPSKAATIVIGAPTPVSPASGATSNGWPTFTVTNASRTGTTAPLMYRFEVSTLPSFASLVVTATVAETPNQTTFTPPAGTPPPPQGALFWRATAIDQVNNVTGTTSTAQNFTFSFPLSDAAQLSLQEGNVLWPGAQPTGTPGHAVLGNFWTVMMATSFSGVTFQSPTLEELQMFDLIDRGLDPQSAIEWLRANGYSTTAAYYPSIAVVGFPYEYMALVNGRWDLVLRVGA
jgi:hypothetical protein